MSDPIVLTRDKVRREWSDFEPKLVAGILSGAGSSVIIAIVTPIAAKAGIVLTPEIQAQIPLAIAGFFGWLTPSVGTTVTKKLAGNGTMSETHSGNPVTTITGPTPIQQPAAGPYAAAGAPFVGKSEGTVSNGGGAHAATNSGQDSVTAILNGSPVTPEPDPASEAPTQVIRAGSAFLSRLPSSTLTGD